jgi:hypothetical protein
MRINCPGPDALPRSNERRVFVAISVDKSSKNPKSFFQHLVSLLRQEQSQHG